MQTVFILKNSDLHLMKMQINFYFWKRCNDKQIFETKKKKKIDHDNKNIKNIFQQNKYWQFMLQALEIKRIFTHASLK